MKRCILGLLVLTGLLQAEFIRDDAKKVVTDTVTCLEWQDNEEANSTLVTWQGAIDYCETLDLDGVGWRLPNFNELYSIGDRRKVDPAIQDGFNNITSSTYWSSTTNAAKTYYAWAVYFNRGDDYQNYKNANGYVRCVRDGQ